MEKLIFNSSLPCAATGARRRPKVGRGAFQKNRTRIIITRPITPPAPAPPPLPPPARENSLFHNNTTFPLHAPTAPHMHAVRRLGMTYTKISTRIIFNAHFRKTLCPAFLQNLFRRPFFFFHRHECNIINILPGQKCTH